MLRERYPVDKLFEEIAVHFPKADPILAKIDSYMEDEQLYQLIKADLSQRRPKTLETGRNSTPSVLKRAHGLGRCLNRGLSGFECWIGWGVIAGNQAVMRRA
jgi:hypothetical protein